MLLKIKHTTHYSYSDTQHMVVQSHRFYPSECDTQRIVSWDVAVDGASFGEYFLDGAGDRIRTMTLNHDINSLEITVTGEIETKDNHGVIKLQRDLLPTQVYLMSSNLTEADQALQALAARSIADAGDNQLDQAHAMMNAISDAIAYISGSTNSTYTAAQALQQGRGVC